MNKKDKYDVTLIDNIDIDGIDWADFPDFTDAYIDSCDYDGVEMTDDQLDDLNDNYADFVYEAVLAYIY